MKDRMKNRYLCTQSLLSIQRHIHFWCSVKFRSLLNVSKNHAICLENSKHRPPSVEILKYFKSQFCFWSTKEFSGLFWERNACEKSSWEFFILHIKNLPGEKSVRNLQQRTVGWHRWHHHSFFSLILLLINVF